MSYVIKAVLSNSGHPEHGQITIPFPIPNANYGHIIEMLEALEIGDPLKQDCRVDDQDSWYGVLDALKGTMVNVDELDYLAMRLDSFADSEAEQFQAMAHKLGLKDIQDFINLTFCCQRATVISDFSKLEQAGRDHRMNLNGGCMSMEESETLDGRKEALQLIATGGGTVTPYGVVYDNGMKLEQLYDGQHLPSYLYDVPVIAVEANSAQCGFTGTLCLPMPDQQLQRMRLRAEIDCPDTWIKVAINELPKKVAEALDLESLSGDDLPGLNRMCRAIAPMKDANTEKLNAVVQMTDAADIIAICQLAENLDQFDFIPGIQTPAEYGKYMIQQSGHFEYDANLEGFYNYQLYGEQHIRREVGRFCDYGYVAYQGTLTLDELMRDEPTEQCQQGPQMGGMA